MLCVVSALTANLLHSKQRDTAVVAQLHLDLAEAGSTPRLSSPNFCGHYIWRQVKFALIVHQTQNCISRVRRFTGLSIYCRDTVCMYVVQCKITMQLRVVQVYY